MKPTLKLLRLKNLPILEQLQLEEALLRTDQNNWCIINEGSSKAIVMGISGKAEQLVEMEHLGKAPVPLIRRFSGGGTVIVDEKTVFITMICNRNAVGIEAFPQQILQWNGELYRHPLRDTPFQVRENDYVFANRKFGGNAQYICKDRWVHHSTLLWDFDDANMKLLKIPQKMPDYREGREHGEFLSRMCEFLPEKERFHREFEESLEKRFTVERTVLEEAAAALTRPHRKATCVVPVERCDVYTKA